MSAQLIHGKHVAAAVHEEVAKEVAALTARGRVPGLGVVLVGADPASRVYVNMKRKACKKLGIHSEEITLDTDASQEEALDAVAKLNRDNQIDGILVQLPLPTQIDPHAVLEAVAPEKDADGFHPLNVGRVYVGKGTLYPCTPLGCIRLIESIGYDLKGKKAVVVGRSNIVGRPLAHMLLMRHATVTVCHSRTVDLAGEVARADVLISAVGAPGAIKGEWIKPGAVVIDVGVNRVEGKLVGDVEFAAAAERAAWITPVPGGVGPMTIAMLMHNTVLLARRRLSGLR